MKSFTFLLICAVAGVRASQTGAEPMRQFHPESESRISVNQPNSVEVSQKSDVEDFELYEFRRGKKVILTIYIGNAPSFRDSEKQASQKVSLNGNTAFSFRKKTRIGLSRDVLVELPTRKRWPTRVHMFYRGLPQRLADVADRMIASFGFSSEGSP
jgi:hypothetical protein